MNKPSHRTKMTSVTEPDRELQAALKCLELPAPELELRQRTLADVRAVLAAQEARRPGDRWRPLLAVAVLLLCAATLPWLLSVPTPQAPAAESESITEWLDLEPELARHVRTRLNNQRRLRIHPSNPLHDRRPERGQEALGITHF